MRNRIFLTLGLLTCLAAVSATTPLTGKISGDYVEARTASVFAGACHYGCERDTTGCDAVMAWSFAAGSWKGVDLAGVRAMAAVSSPKNLEDQTAPRKTELVVDSSLSDPQMVAVADLIKTRCGSQLGQVVSVRRAAITFKRDGRSYRVSAAGFAAINMDPMPNDECCTQPELVWYAPLMQLEHRKVGFTQEASYTAGRVGDPWQRQDENSAFYGAFSF